MSVKDFSPMTLEEIEEKIAANAAVNIDLPTLRERLARELNQRKWELIKNQINIQSITEQLEVIDHKLKEQNA